MNSGCRQTISLLTTQCAAAAAATGIGAAAGWLFGSASQWNSKTGREDLIEQCRLRAIQLPEGFDAQKGKKDGSYLTNQAHAALILARPDWSKPKKYKYYKQYLSRIIYIIDGVRGNSKLS